VRQNAVRFAVEEGERVISDLRKLVAERADAGLPLGTGDRRRDSDAASGVGCEGPRATPRRIAAVQRRRNQRLQAHARQFERRESMLPIRQAVPTRAVLVHQHSQHLARQ
jgi:hypothetical protein